MTNNQENEQLQNDNRLSRLIEEALLEDVGMGDITTDSIIRGDLFGRGELKVKENGVIAGLEVADAVFALVDHEIAFRQMCADGTAVENGFIAAFVEGNFGDLLKAERTVLNIVQRMSGIATLTRRFTEAVAGTRAKITDTRKTVPGLRMLDKLAVRIGGGVNHRFGLDDMVLIKDNHIAAAGGIVPALDRCLEYLQNARLDLRIEIETKDLGEVDEVLKHGGVHRIMLDNFQPGVMHKAVEMIAGRVETEASGNVTLENIRPIAETGVDFISIGALTHSVMALDCSLKIAPMR
jgi:nicotinate-nucleotide pyrophosphorylase (carboxylating)